MTPQQLAEEYANSIVPNPDRYDAPYYTTRDKHEDLEEAFIKGYEANQSKWISLPTKELLEDGYYCIKIKIEDIEDIKFDRIKNGIIPYHFAVAYFKVELP